MLQQPKRLPQQPLLSISFDRITVLFRNAHTNAAVFQTVRQNEHQQVIVPRAQAGIVALLELASCANPLRLSQPEFVLR